ncbi:MAG TPA: fibronectin type III domain-containing protein [Pyrinomonadaceae bacterium]|jgi:hypothetical protein
MRKITFPSTAALTVALALHLAVAAAAAQLTIPAAPSNLTATAISTSAITINWVDNSDNEDGFKIEMCQGSNCSDFVTAGYVTTGATNATVSGLGKNRTCKFRVRAYNAAGDSAYSNIAQATTLR